MEMEMEMDSDIIAVYSIATEARKIIFCEAFFESYSFMLEDDIAVVGIAKELVCLSMQTGDEISLQGKSVFPCKCAPATEVSNTTPH
jgi:hypothetical protein